MSRRSKGLNFRKKKRELNIPLLREIATWILEIAIAVAIAGVINGKRHGGRLSGRIKEHIKNTALCRTERKKKYGEQC